MKLYYAPGACSQSPHIALREAGVDFELEKVDLASKTTERGTDYRQINPRGYVPALEIAPGNVLIEGPAIVQYIADQYPAANLAPRAGTMERYHLQSWLNFISAEIHKSFGPFFGAGFTDDAKSKFAQHLAQRFSYLQTHLASRQYLMGDSFSVADPYLFVNLSWVSYTGLELQQWPALVDYRNRIAGRPAVQAALQAEGLA